MVPVVAVYRAAEVGSDSGELHAVAEDLPLHLIQMDDSWLEDAVVVVAVSPLNGDDFGVVVESRSQDAGGDVYRRLVKLPFVA